MPTYALNGFVPVTFSFPFLPISITVVFSTRIAFLVGPPMGFLEL